VKRLTLPAAALLGAISLGLALSGCHDTHGTSPAAPPSSASSPTAPSSSGSAQAPASPAKLVAYVLNPKATGDGDLLIARPVTLRHPESPARDAVETLLTSDHSPLPPGTALRGLSIDSGVATLDFSRSPVNETGGEGGQSAALNALALTLGQFPDVKQYQIEVKGRPMTEFGEFTADGPMDVTRPGASPQISDSGQ